MSQLRGFLHRLRVLIAPDAYAREVDAEMHFHLDLDTAHQRADGLSAEDAVWAARRRFGNITYARERVREMSRAEWADGIMQDLRYAVRGLRRSPAFTVMVALLLGLGLGVNGAMFAFLDRIFLRMPTAVVDPARVRRLYLDQSRPSEPGGRYVYGQLLYAEARAIGSAMTAAGDTTPIGLFEASPDAVHIMARGQSMTAMRAIASAGYFRVLGVTPVAGRFFGTDEDRVEMPTPAVVIGYDLWQRAFGGARSAIGDSLRIGPRIYTVIGVAPRGFAGVDLEPDALWIPISMYDASTNGAPWYDGFQNGFAVITRIPDDAAEQRFRAMATVAERTVHVKGWGYDSTIMVRSGPMHFALGPARMGRGISIGLQLAGVSLLVLLLACANVSNLLLVRATRRARETALRRTLGVSRARLLRQLLTESTLLALLGAAAALLLAYWGTAALRHLLLPDVRWGDGAIDARTIVFAGVLAVTTGILAGLAPAMQAARGDLARSLRAGREEGAYRQSRLRTTLLVAQVAVSVVLVVGAGLSVQSFRNIEGIDLGYARDQVLMVRPVFAAGGDSALD